jgi:ATP-dependent RNA helicase RhlE
MDLTTNNTNGFATTGISPTLLSIVNNSGLTQPTPIQEQAIPIALQGLDIIGVAQTGTGKTLAFALPLLDRLRDSNGTALILVPTRELALQVEEVVRGIARRLKPAMPTTVVIGGTSMYAQISAMHRHPRIIIATPGRLQDHLNQGTVNLSGVSMLILDEADRMLDMGFITQISRIVKSVPVNRQTMLFSATMSPEVTRLAADYLRDPVRIEVAKSGTTVEQVEQQLCYVEKDRKPEVLTTLLDQYAGSVLVFSRTKHGAAKLSKRLIMAGYHAAEIHSDRSLSQRRSALEGFKTGRFRVLVATDVAARGLDVDDIELVINYDLPDAAEDYVHRIGRTGRAGKAGVAISLADHDQYADVLLIERLINMPLPLSEHSEPTRKTISVSPARFSNQRRQPAQRGPSQRNSSQRTANRGGGNSSWTSFATPNRAARW